MTKHVVLAVALLTACSKSSGSDAKGSSTPSVTKLPNVGLQADIPGSDVMVSDGLDSKSQMVNTADLGGMSIQVMDTPATLDEVKSDFEMMTPKNLKTETLADGFVVSFENTGSMGTNYWVEVRRTIGGKHVKCATMSDAASKATAVIAACKSLRT